MGGLSISRRPGEKFYLGDSVVVEVHEVRGNKVILSITAPKAVKVLRSELLEPGQAAIIEHNASKGRG